MSIQTKKYTSHVTFSLVSCMVDVGKIEEVISFEEDTFTILSRSSTINEYNRDDDISEEDELTQQLIKNYWENYKGDLKHEEKEN